MNIKLREKDIHDFKQASDVLREGVKDSVIESSELGYITASLLSVCINHMQNGGDTATLKTLDDAMGLVMNISG